MTLSREVAAYETGLVVYMVIAVVATAALYRWATTTLDESNFLRRMNEQSTYLRVLMRMAILWIMAAVGMGWPAGLVGYALCKIVLKRSRAFEHLSVRENLTEAQSGVLDLMNYGDSAMALVTLVQNSIVDEGAIRTRRFLEIVLEHWDAFVEEQAYEEPEPETGKPLKSET